MNEQLKTALLWGLVIAAIFFFVMHFGQSPERAQAITFSQFVRDVKSHGVTSVTLQQNKVTGQLSSGTKFSTYNPETNNTALLGRLERNHVRIIAKPPPKPSFFMSLLENVLPFVLLIGLWWWLMRSMMQGGGGAWGALVREKPRQAYDRRSGPDHLRGCRRS